MGLGFRGSPVLGRHIQSQADVEVTSVCKLHEYKETRHHWSEGRICVLLEPRVHVPVRKLGFRVWGSRIGYDTLLEQRVHVPLRNLGFGI